MTKLAKLRLWTVALALAATLASQRAHADPSQVLEIRVSINAVKSLSAGTTYYNFGALELDTSSTSATAILITNDSGAFVETYTLQGGNAVSDTGGVNWTLASSTDTNQYALAAMFSDARPDNTQVDWDSTDYLTGSPQACTATQFGNGTLAEAGVDVSPLAGQNERNLWFRIHTPGVSTGTESRTAQVTIAVQ